MAEILGILLLAVTLGVGIDEIKLHRYVNCERVSEESRTNIVAAGGDVAIAAAREDEQFAIWVDDHENGEPANDESFKQALHDAAATRRHMVEVYWRNPPHEC